MRWADGALAEALAREGGAARRVAGEYALRVDVFDGAGVYVVDPAAVRFRVESPHGGVNASCSTS